MAGNIKVGRLKPSVSACTTTFTNHDIQFKEWKLATKFGGKKANCKIFSF